MRQVMVQLPGLGRASRSLLCSLRGWPGAAGSGQPAGLVCPWHSLAPAAFPWKSRGKVKVHGYPVTHRVNVWVLCCSTWNWKEWKTVKRNIQASQAASCVSSPCQIPCAFPPSHSLEPLFLILKPDQRYFSVIL